MAASSSSRGARARAEAARRGGLAALARVRVFAFVGAGMARAV
jgi:hypothetical protein